MEQNAINGNNDANEDILIGNIEGEPPLNNSEMIKKRILIIILSVLILAIIIIISVVFYSYLTSDNEIDYCIIGENDKCHSCIKKSKNCKSCNPYFRLENGKCNFIYSFEAIYKSYDLNNETKLFNVDHLTDYKVNKIQVDDEYVEDNNN